MRIKQLGFLAIFGAFACIAQQPAAAQTAVPLERSLLDYQWWVIDFAGKQGGGAAPTFRLTDDHHIVVGTTQCETDWSARVHLNFPEIHFETPQTGAFACEGAADVNRFLLALEKATRFRTSPDGLELIDTDGKRVVLMVAGG